MTINPARILKWDHALGSIEAGKRADLLVLDGTTGDPYDHLIGAQRDSDHDGRHQRCAALRHAGA